MRRTSRPPSRGPSFAGASARAATGRRRAPAPRPRCARDGRRRARGAPDPGRRPRHGAAAHPAGSSLDESLVPRRAGARSRRHRRELEAWRAALRGGGNGELDDAVVEALRGAATYADAYRSVEAARTARSEKRQRAHVAEAEESARKLRDGQSRFRAPGLAVDELGVVGRADG